MRIGVTGGAGYIAGHLIWDLLELGHTVLVLDNLSTGNMENIVRDHAGYSFMEGDISNVADLKAFFKHDLEAVFHFAGSKAAGESMEFPALYSANNLRGSFLLFETMVAAGCPYLVFSSSAAVYGMPEYLPVDEAHPLCPINYYGYTKKAVEENLEWYARLGKLHFAALRYFNAGGYDLRGRVGALEQKPQNLLPRVLDVAVGQNEFIEIYGVDYDTPDGTCIRDYIHVNDLCRAHVLALDYIRQHGKDLVLNLGAGEGLSVREILAMAGVVSGRPIPVKETGRRPGDPSMLVADASRAFELLGWRAEHSDARTLIESSWQVYKRHGGGNSR